MSVSETSPLIQEPESPTKFGTDLLGKKEQNRATFEGTGGNSQEYYDVHWWRGFDMAFLIGMLLWLTILVVLRFDLLLLLLLLCWLTALSIVFNPMMFSQPGVYWSFWVEGVAKLLLESSIGFLGGLLVIYRNVKVNYVRKIQHFCAYLIPLLFATFMPKIVRDPGLSPLHALGLSTLDTWWGYWFMMNAFFLLIFPLRSRIWPLFVCFASMDRPEDRPHTLKVRDRYNYYCNIKRDLQISTFSSVDFYPSVSWLLHYVCLYIYHQLAKRRLLKSSLHCCLHHGNR
jgi:hypothetical protein